MNFHTRMKELRNKQGLSQKLLAEQMGCSQQSIAKWETGGATPNPDALSRLADIFSVSVDYLIGRADPMYDQEAAVKFALFGGQVDDETYEEVKRFAQYIRHQKQQK